MSTDPKSSDPLLARLPTAYAVALRLRAAGGSDEAIAGALGIDVNVVATLLEVAERKREVLRDTGATGGRPASSV
ncbi:MAG: hypothetical protein ABJH68_06970 [Ilumatobacter sp.]|uniref:hypothetical protein n=1 Tax=Ilumatobacter sp. TaxID=1967498 RepID=UPI003299D406